MDQQKVRQELGLDRLDVIIDRPGVAVYRAERQGRPMLLKFHENPDKVRREVECLSALASKGAPVPGILGEGVLEGTPFFLEEWWDGVTFLEAYGELRRSEQVRLLREAGRFLARWQQVLDERELEAMTWWRARVPESVSGLSDFRWVDLISQECYAWIERIRLTEEDLALGVDRLLAKTKTVLEKIPEPPQLALLHYDYGLRNLMLTPERDAIRGLFDFEAVRLGDPLYDVIKMTFNDIPEDAEGCRAYLEGYREASGRPFDQDRFRLYQAVNGIGAMAWVDKYDGDFRLQNLDFREKGRRVLIQSMCEGL